MWRKIKKPILALAPMAGITDSAFRLISKEQGADVVYSEMASSSALYFKPKRTLELLRFCSKEQPYVVQLFGKNPEHFARAARIITQGVPQIKYDKTDKTAQKRLAPGGIDINFGCPAKKVFGHGSGAALMDKPKLAKRIIQAVTSNTSLEVSIKVRTQVKGVKLLDFLREIKINKLKITAIMVHGRTYSQGFSGPVDFETIKKVKQYFGGIVLANGGIKNLEDARIILKKTGADGVGVGTGADGNPMIFKDLKILKNKNNPAGGKARDETRELEEKIKIITRQADYVYKLKGRRGILELRKHLIWYFKGLEGIRKLHADMVGVKNPEDVKKIVHKVRKSQVGKF
ncbi:MAG: tRNA-dihydrouridine synthase [Patescibacteria group bacterium]|nr:tRNA-dihydrouridine synthase [Patescibacteria group bacterium]